jgi:hypothetical protein
MIVGSEITLLIMFAILLLQTQVFDNVEIIIIAVTGFFSLLLLALSISAYRKTGFRNIIYAAAAFAIFGIQLLFESFKDTFETWDTGVGSVITASMTLAILVLFFLAIVKRLGK